MNIGILAIHSSPLGKLGTRDNGGMSVYLLETAQKIGKRGHCVDIFTLGQENEGVSVQPLAENVRLIHLEITVKEKIAKESLFEYLPLVFTAYREQLSSLNCNYDVIHSHYWLSGLLGIMIQKEYTLPHYTTFHTLGKVKNISCPNERESNLRISSEGTIAAECDSIVAFTKEEKNNLCAYYGTLPGKITIIPCGVDSELFQPVTSSQLNLGLGLSDDDKVLLFVGRKVPIKGVDTLLQAVAQLADRYPLKCIIVGDEEENIPGVVKVQKYSDELRLAANIFNVGGIDHNDLPLYYSAADAVVVPSLHESFGLVVLEALACGTPVIGSAVGIIPQIINGTNGRIVTPGDVSELAEAIMQMIDGSDERLGDCHKIRRSVEDYSWDNVAERLLNVYSVERTTSGG